MSIKIFLNDEMNEEMLKDVKLINYMEVAVCHYLPNLMKAFPDACSCEHCILDIKALALNQLKPHYIVTGKGQLYSQLTEMSTQFETDVLQALVDAIIKVSKTPRHKKEPQQP